MNPTPRASDLRLRFPNASESFLRLHGLAPELPKSGPVPPPPMSDTPPPSKPATGQKKGRLRQSSTGLNKTEEAFKVWIAAHPLSMSVLTQAVTLKIANGCRYTPDFIVLSPTGSMLAYEVKGFMREDAAVKLKVAASLYPWIRFHLVTRKKGEWLIQEILP